MPPSTAIPFKQLYDLLEEGVELPSSVTMEAILSDNYDKLFNLFKYFKKPSEESKKKLETEKLEIKFKKGKVVVGEKLKALITEISELLELDEFQSFELLQNYLQYNRESLDSFPVAGTLFQYYYDERYIY